MRFTKDSEPLKYSAYRKRRKHGRAYRSELSCVRKKKCCRLRCQLCRYGYEKSIFRHTGTLRIEEGMNHCDIESHPDAFTEYCKFIMDLAKVYG